MIKNMQYKIVEMFTSVAQKYSAWRYRKFTPSNRLKIRNVPESYADHNERFFHAAFTVLCDFVENERGGESKIETDISKHIESIDPNSSDWMLTVQREDIAADRTMLELYGWYNSIDWNDPVPMTDEYRSMIEQAEYVSTPTGHGTYSLQVNHPQKDEYARQRAAYAVREQQFEKIKIKKLMQLCEVHAYLWN